VAAVLSQRRVDFGGCGPAHCTGWRALWALLNTFGESVVTPCAVGSRFTF